MARLILLNALFLVGAGAVSKAPPARGRAPFLAPARQPSPLALVAAAAPAPVAAAPPVAAPAAAPPVDCAPICKQAKQMWKDAEESQEVAIALDKNRTAARILAEADLLAEDVKLKVHAHGQNIVHLLDEQVAGYMDGRVRAFDMAVTNRHAQVLSAEQQQFGTLQAHQGKLVEALMTDLVVHGYETAKSSSAHEAAKAGAEFNSNPKVKDALQQVTKAGESWAKSYHDTEAAAKDGFVAWSGAYHNLNSTWSNVTNTFVETNDAARAARGLGPDVRWVNQMVRVAGDVAQAATTASAKEAAEVDVADEMSRNSAALVSGNSGSIVTLNEMLDKVERQTDQASISTKKEE